jgi:hypothetical protein
MNNITDKIRIIIIKTIKNEIFFYFEKWELLLVFNIKIAIVV